MAIVVLEVHKLQKRKINARGKWDRAGIRIRRREPIQKKERTKDG